MMRHTILLCSTLFFVSAYSMEESPCNQETYTLDDNRACLNECLEEIKDPAVWRKALDLLDESEELRIEYITKALKNNRIKCPYEATLIRYSLDITPAFLPKKRKDINALRRTHEELEKRASKRSKQIHRLQAAQERDNQIQEHIARLLDTHDQES